MSDLTNENHVSLPPPITSTLSYCLESLESNLSLDQQFEEPTFSSLNPNVSVDEEDSNNTSAGLSSNVFLSTSSNLEATHHKVFSVPSKILCHYDDEDYKNRRHLVYPHVFRSTHLNPHRQMKQAKNRLLTIRNSALFKPSSPPNTKDVCGTVELVKTSAISLLEFTDASSHNSIPHHRGHHHHADDNRLLDPASPSLKEQACSLTQTMKRRQCESKPWSIVPRQSDLLSDQQFAKLVFAERSLAAATDTNNRALLVRKASRRRKRRLHLNYVSFQPTLTKVSEEGSSCSSSSSSSSSSSPSSSSSSAAPLPVVSSNISKKDNDTSTLLLDSMFYMDPDESDDSKSGAFGKVK